MTTPYQMCVNNVASYIRNQSRYDVEKAERDGDKSLDAFEASRVLAIAFCKASAEEVLVDIITAKVPRQTKPNTKV